MMSMQNLNCNNHFFFESLSSDRIFFLQVRETLKKNGNTHTMKEKREGKERFFFSCIHNFFFILQLNFDNLINIDFLSFVLEESSTLTSLVIK